jgi:hypothetical protein
LKIYCDQKNSNITTQFLTEHLLTLQDFCKCSIWLLLLMRQTSKRYSNSSHSLSKKVTPMRAMALIRISYGCLPQNQWQPYSRLVKKILKCQQIFCKKLCCDITIRLVTIHFHGCIPYSVKPCTVVPAWLNKGHEEN